MQTELQNGPLPKWLKEDVLTFDIDNILSNSLYYPSSGYDGTPIKYFSGNVHSFIYADYGFQQETLEKNMHKGLWGYHLIHNESIQKNQFIPSAWKKLVRPDSEERERMDLCKTFMKPPLAHWAVYERDLDCSETHGPERISLFFIGGDGAFTYQALYLHRKITPKILAVIQPGHGFGGNYTDFYDDKKLFYRSVIYRDEPDYYPEYFFTNIIYHSWLKHKNLLKRIHSKREKLFLWKLDDEIQARKRNI